MDTHHIFDSLIDPAYSAVLGELKIAMEKYIAAVEAELADRPFKNTAPNLKEIEDAKAKVQGDELIALNQARDKFIALLNTTNNPPPLPSMDSLYKLKRSVKSENLVDQTFSKLVINLEQKINAEDIKKFEKQFNQADGNYDAAMEIFIKNPLIEKTLFELKIPKTSNETRQYDALQAFAALGDNKKIIAIIDKGYVNISSKNNPLQVLVDTISHNQELIQTEEAKRNYANTIQTLLEKSAAQKTQLLTPEICNQLVTLGFDDNKKIKGPINEFRYSQAAITVQGKQGPETFNIAGLILQLQNEKGHKMKIFDKLIQKKIDALNTLDARIKGGENIIQTIDALENADTDVTKGKNSRVKQLFDNLRVEAAKHGDDKITKGPEQPRPADTREFRK